MASQLNATKKFREELKPILLKLFQINFGVESDQFESIWQDESSTCIVINEGPFKKDILDRKGPFRIFETKSMKSLVLQLNFVGLVKSDKRFRVLLHHLTFWKKKTMSVFRVRYFMIFTYWQNVRLNHVTQKACSHMQLKLNLKLRSNFVMDFFI